ncbi:MAG: hypothetical protein QOH16_722 [Gaiellaceae bacterium]|nr:hypothetical protein [Gaiellaceae bacterium]
MPPESGERGQALNELFRDSPRVRQAASSALAIGLQRHGPEVVGLGLYGFVFLLFGTYLHFVLGLSIPSTSIGAIATAVITYLTRRFHH